MYTLLDDVYYSTSNVQVYTTSPAHYCSCMYMYLTLATHVEHVGPVTKSMLSMVGLGVLVSA